MHQLFEWVPVVVGIGTVIVNAAVSLSTVGRHEGHIESLRDKVQELEKEVAVLKDRVGR